MFTATDALRALFLKSRANNAYCGPRQHGSEVLSEHRRQVRLFERSKLTNFVESHEEEPAEKISFGKLGVRR